MGDAGYTQLLDLAAGALLLTAVLVLWRREPAAVNRYVVLQGIALAGLAGVRAAREGSVALAALAAVILVLQSGVLPYLVHRLPARPVRPLVAVPGLLLAAGALTLVAFAVARPVIRLAPSPATRAVPAGVAVLLIGFLMLVAVRGAAGQALGFLLVGNGIAAAAVLTTTAVPLLAGLLLALDLLFAALVWQILAADTDPAELRELHD